ncbi:MAG TPA: hypothetical protein VFH57_03825 [Gammaproteobacteria bacterium]|nr:hypothetical protein [Gammaproteobacteria bacterium]
MTSGTSEISSHCGSAAASPPIAAPFNALRKRLGIWRLRRWAHDSPRAVQAAAVDAWRHVHLTATDVRHIHLVREAGLRRNWDFFRWLEENEPATARLFRHTTTVGPLARPAAGTALLIPWLWDPVRERNQSLYRRLRALEKRYERAGIPIVNPVSHLSNAIKSVALTRLRDAGFATARALRLTAESTFDAIAVAVGLPFIVRNDHGSRGYVQLVYTSADFQQVDWTQLPHPVALEYLDTRSADGRYRKYRYLVTGDTGINRHLIIAQSWCVHADDRIRRQAYVKEELAFLHEPNPYQEQLIHAARILSLDFAAFDYGIDRAGRLVIWEANPFPGLWPPSYDQNRDYDYQRAWVDNVFRHILRFYLRRAGLDRETLGDKHGRLHRYF